MRFVAGAYPGRATDDSGAVVPRVTIRAARFSTNVSATAVSDSERNGGLQYLHEGADLSLSWGVSVRVQERKLRTAERRPQMPRVR